MLKFGHQQIRAQAKELECFTPKASDQIHYFGLFTPFINLGHKLKLADSILEGILGRCISSTKVRKRGKLLSQQGYR